MFPSGTGFKNKLQKLSLEKKVSEYVIDETIIKVGPEYVWIWIAIIEADNKEILRRMSMSKERKICLG